MTEVLRELYGQWWFKEGQPHVMGRLVIQVDGSVRLDLAGSLMRFDDTEPVLWGIAEGVPVTLTHCFPLTQRGLGPGPGGEFQSVHAQQAYVGAHFYPDDAIFSSARIGLENLTGFLAAPVVDRRVDGDRLGLAAAVSDHVSAARHGEWLITARSHANTFTSVETRANTTVSTTVTPHLHLTPSKPVAVGAFNGLILHLSDLMTLASGEACGLISTVLTVVAKPGTDAANSIGGDTLERFVSMPTTLHVYGRRTHTASPDSLGTSFHAFRFTCDDIAFEDVIPRWLSIREEAETACNVFFGMQYARPGYTETRLLLSAIAAEGFHAAFSDTTAFMPAEQFEALRATVLDAVEDEEQRTWVGSVLSNRMSFRRRLRALARIPDGDARDLVVPDIEAWAGDVVAARNTLAHTGNHIHGTNPFTLEQMTAGLLTLVLMERLGLSSDRQQRAARELTAYS